MPRAVFRDDLAGRMLTFSDPHALIVAEDPDELPEAFARMEEARASGHWLAGYVAYEAGFLLDPAFSDLPPVENETPYLCFGVFDPPEEADLPEKRSETPFLFDLEPAWDFAAYRKRFEPLHAHLMAGDCYQGNLTFPINARWQGDPLAAFHAYAERQPVRYGAYLELAGPRILSRSPELFFKVDDNGFIETHPMKGTAPRGTTAAGDEAIVAAMLDDEKTLAENCMIVDLLRNDISRIAEPGSVHVPKLFEIETYPTLHQMVSHVRAKLNADAGIAAIFSALFPCGSVTGAPKISAMKILRRLEDGPRGAYCGAIGHIAPDGAMRFNVAIRTITLFDDGRAVFNVGGGIVLDSTARAEYEEALLKARFAGDLSAQPAG
ncbi:aminodeoxychorismate synthase component I [Martelella radicis]|uniref:Para-aminobenzoate synthetase component 1 n=1 Tax=Martelella radicis TaxID=1397476 RepID=A0A7W6PA31_9HYPH|nr:aminodeoxychorismate synthase component I [Martelella radicis]MBB4122410.1 para-aminobenzoate synthetase component 1 [Martelella radicis]